MPVEITDTITSIQTSLSQAPAAVLAIVLLGGPTAAWIIYRLVVSPRPKRDLGRPDDVLWICDQCRSANEVRRDQCYRCGYHRDATAGDLHVVDGEGLVMLPPLEPRPSVGPGVPVGPGTPAGPGVPVGPGVLVPVMDAATSGPATDDAAVTADVAAAFNAAVAATAAVAAVPVGPVRPEVSVPRRVVTSGTPAAASATAASGAPTAASAPADDRRP